jgi:macrolide transport system ATP-binding/permease protein
MSSWVKGILTVLFTISHVAKGFGPATVLSDVSFTVNATDKLALVGANGVGKTTLLRIIAGEIEPDGGEVIAPRPVATGYLPQVVTFRQGQTIDDLVYEAQGRIEDVRRRLHEVETALGRAGERETGALLEEYGELSEQFERLGGYALDYRMDAVFGGLGIAHLPRNREVASLSGGEKARIALAALLLGSPEVLLLDEPTNHLDFRALAWLETYLHAYHGAFVLVSHDRQFLNRTVSTIVEIDEYLRDARIYPGDYDAYLVAKAKERARWQEEYAREQAEIKALREAIKGTARRVGHPNRPPPDNDKYAKQFFGENVQRAVARNVRAAQEKLRRIEADPIVKPPEPMRLHTDFDPHELAGHTPLAASGVRKAYGGRRVLDGVDFVLNASARVVIVGPNGAGKSTLLRILAGKERPDAGRVSRAPSVVIGYLDQEQEGLDPHQTVFEAYRAGLAGHEDALRADLFRYGFFRYDDVRKKVGELSAGQRRKLQLARLMVTRANVLLLDEPTNHLDFPTLEAFEAALLEYPGPILAVSHDRRFIQRFRGEVLVLDGGRLTPAPADVDALAPAGAHGAGPVAGAVSFGTRG